MKRNLTRHYRYMRGFLKGRRGAGGLRISTDFLSCQPLAFRTNHNLFSRFNNFWADTWHLRLVCRSWCFVCFSSSNVKCWKKILLWKFGVIEFECFFHRKAWILPDPPRDYQQAQAVYFYFTCHLKKSIPIWCDRSFFANSKSSSCDIKLTFQRW